MSEEAKAALPPEILRHYAQCNEAGRLLNGVGQLEMVRTQELISRFAPPPPAVVLDIGGGAGIHALWLARLGYEVHLVDPVQLHVEQATAASAQQPDFPIARCLIGDARRLDQADASADLVMLLGPLYHLTDRADRLSALSEARRVLRPGGCLLAAAISRFASTLDGLREGYLADPAFVQIARQDLLDGQHRNPDEHPAYFTTAFFHHPAELESEIRTSGLVLERTVAVEGPAWLLQNVEDQLRDEGRRDRLLEALRWIESEPSMLGASVHMIGVARRSDT